MIPSTARSVAETYDRSLLKGHDARLPADCPVPKPTHYWPPENVALLERYREWLLSSATSPSVVDTLYLSTAGHALGLNLKPHPQLNLDSDLDTAMDYIRAKKLSAEWTSMCRNALAKFRLFLHQQRGQVEVSVRLPDYSRYCQGLPEWLVRQLERYAHLRQRNWRPARLREQMLCFWDDHTRLWRWLFAHYPIGEIGDVKRQYLTDYIAERLGAGYAVSGVNEHLRCFHATLVFLQEQDFAVPQALLRLPSLKQPDRLPRFLTDEEVRRLRDDFEERVREARFPAQRRDALLDRAAFYLLWQGGLRLGEVEDLQLEDLDLAARRLTVRQGKGSKDHTVYLTERTVEALRDYLGVRGQGAEGHVFLYRNQAVRKDLIHSRIKLAGERVGVKVYPHRLRHTYATQLLNAGYRVTSIQKLLGHRRLNSTMVYARVHDQTVAQDYFTAMEQVEKRLDVGSGRGSHTELPSQGQRTLLLGLVAELAEPMLSADKRLYLVEQMRQLLENEPLAHEAVEAPMLRYVDETAPSALRRISQNSRLAGASPLLN